VITHVPIVDESSARPPSPKSPRNEHPETPSRSGCDAARGAPEEPPPRTSAKPAPGHLIDAPVWSETADVDRDRFAEAVRLNRQHWMDTGRPISAETLWQQLHVSADTSRELTRAVRAADRAAVIAAGASNSVG